MSEAIEMDARLKRCPGCAPGYGTGIVCPHHRLAHQPDAQLRQRVDANMRRAVRNMLRRMEETMYGINRVLHG